VVLDEPTAAMPAPEVGRLFEAVERLRRQGLGVIYVSHHLQEILDLADDVTVLRNGEVVLQREVAGLTHDDLVTAVVGRELAQLMHAHVSKAVRAHREVLVVERLRTPVVHEVSFSVGAGEIVGLAGIVGSGRDSVLPAIAGAITRDGTVRISDTIVAPNRPSAATRAGLGFVPANRRRSAVLPSFDASSNLTVSGLSRYVRYGLLSHRAEKSDAQTWFEDLDISPRSPSAPILTFSGGNQQKVMVGRWLRRDPAVLALDEPTQGVDVGAKQAIYLSLQRAAKTGSGVLVSSSDGEELAAICHRVLVFVRGRIAAELTGAQVEAERIDALSLHVREEANQ
jgi:ribose transport system ATP-binding protein